MGSRNIDLSEDDYVIDMVLVSGQEDVLAISENGFGKRTSIDEYRVKTEEAVGLLP